MSAVGSAIKGADGRRPARSIAGRAGVLCLALPLVLAASIAFGASKTVLPVFGKKVYFPGTNSYYELVPAEQGDSYRGARVREISWDRARQRASQRSHNGVQGRLAVIKSNKLHQFLEKEFRPRSITWIGLRYWCRFNRLQWVTGEFFDRNGFAPWDTVWARASTQPPRTTQKPPCRGSKWFWPVHYWGTQHGFRWNANSMNKEGRAYIVEYPTGKP